MTYGKLIDGDLVIAPRTVIVGDRHIGNPPSELLVELGYKPVTFTEPPEVETGYIAVPVWTETAEAIVQTWTVEPEPDEISEDRAYRIIAGEEE